MVTENCSHNELHEDKHIQTHKQEEGKETNDRGTDLLGEVVPVGSCFGGPSDQDAAPHS